MRVIASTVTAAVLLVGTLLGVWLLLSWFARRGERWGATPEELDMPLPKLLSQPRPCSAMPAASGSVPTSAASPAP